MEGLSELGIEPRELAEEWVKRSCSSSQSYSFR
jgi:hypothetical protein